MLDTANSAPVRVGIVQNEVKIDDYEVTIEQALRMIGQCADRGCRLVCLPEAFATSVNLPRAKTVSERIPGRTSDMLCREAYRKGIYIVAGILEQTGSNVYSSAVLIDSLGRIMGVARKAHIFQLEKYFICAGDTVRLYETPIGRLGMIVGYDIYFPEICRSMFRQRAELIICPSQLPDVFMEATTLLVKARAAENCCYFVFASSVGENNMARIRYMGNSMIAQSPVCLDPFSTEYMRQGDVLARAGFTEETIDGTLDLEKIRRNQEENPQLKDILPAGNTIYSG